MQGALLLKWVLYPHPSHSEDLNSSVQSDKICKNVQIAGGRVANIDKFFALVLIQIILFLTRLFFIKTNLLDF